MNFKSLFVILGLIFGLFQNGYGQETLIVDYLVVNARLLAEIDDVSLNFIQNGKIVPAYDIDPTQVYCNRVSYSGPFGVSGKLQITFPEYVDGPKYNAVLEDVGKLYAPRARLQCSHRTKAISFQDLQYAFSGVIEMQ